MRALIVTAAMLLLVALCAGASMSTNGRAVIAEPRGVASGVRADPCEPLTHVRSLPRDGQHLRMKAVP